MAKKNSQTAKASKQKKTNGVEKAPLDTKKVYAEKPSMTKSERLLHQAMYRIFNDGDEVNLEDAKKGFRQKRNADMLRLYNKGFALEDIAKAYYPLFDLWGEPHPRYNHFIEMTRTIIKAELARQGQACVEGLPPSSIKAELAKEGKSYAS